jgi:undecaprenyl phosphate-alpha-L-ara4N flippase subunit ArnE
MKAAPLGLALVLAAVLVESGAQLFLKLAAQGRNRGRWIGLGLVAYGVEIALYTAALRWLDVSVAFPLGSLCFIGVALLSRAFLGETVGRVRWLGIGCILAGAVLVTC